MARMPDAPSTITLRASAAVGPTRAIRRRPALTSARTHSAPQRVLPKPRPGKAVIATDERLAGTGAAGRAGISRVDVWSTDKMPIDNSDAASELQRKGFVVRHNYVGSGQG